MSENPEETIQRLLREGLDHYGVDEVTAAIVTWEKVLELDPGNVEAHDYLRNADRRRLPRGEAPPSDAAPAVPRGTLVQEAQMLLRQENFAAAVGLLERASGPDLRDLEYHAVYDLARSRLFAEYCARIGNFAQVPQVRGDARDVTQFNLRPNAGFVLSMIDGQTCLEDLIALAGMDAFEALHTLCDMLDAGIVEMGD